MIVKINGYVARCKWYEVKDGRMLELVDVPFKDYLRYIDPTDPRKGDFEKYLHEKVHLLSKDCLFRLNMFQATAMNTRLGRVMCKMKSIESMDESLIPEYFNEKELIISKSDKTLDKFSL
jgi:hypothetical protein